MPLLAGIGPLGLPELLVIAFIIILIFGVGRLPEVGGAVGRGIREFRKATKDEDKTQAVDASAAPSGDVGAGPPAPTIVPGAGGGAEAGASASGAARDAIFCSECGTKNARSAKFCAECGHAIAAPVG